MTDTPESIFDWQDAYERLRSEFDNLQRLLHIAWKRIEALEAENAWLREELEGYEEEVGPIPTPEEYLGITTEALMQLLLPNHRTDDRNDPK